MATINLNDEKFAGDSDGFKAIPAGNYTVTVFGAKVGEFGDPKPGKGNNKGKKYLNVQFRIAEGEYTNRRLFAIVGLFTNWADKTTAEPNEEGPANFTFANFFKALGFEEVDVDKPEKLIEKIQGEELVITVKQKDNFKGEIDPETNAVKKENEVTGFKARGSAKTSVAVTKPTAGMKI